MTPVLFTGAGPGDPELLTLKARQAIEQAQAVFHDELVPEAIWGLSPHAAPYQNPAQLIAAAQAGLRVVRLQVGDPTIYGRLVEQMEALDQAGVPYEVIPGVTAATAAAAAAKISLTHKTLGRTVALVTAHDPSIPVPDADTVVFYMGRPSRPGPALAVENVSRPQQQIFRDDLTAVQAPSIVISGAVANLKSLPLYGQRIVVTRAESSRMNVRLRALGADVIEFPVIAIVPPADPAPLIEAAASLNQYDWLIFTSVNGVTALFDRVDDLRGLRARICTIGPATKAAVEKLKLKVDVVPSDYVGEGLAAALPSDLAGQRILIPRATVARDVVPEALRERGAVADVVNAYRTIVPQPTATLPSEYDWVTFTSSSTVKNFLALAGSPKGRIASIGPITTATLRQHGLEPTIEALEYTTDGIVAALERALRTAD